MTPKAVRCAICGPTCPTCKGWCGQLAWDGRAWVPIPCREHDKPVPT